MAESVPGRPVRSESHDERPETFEFGAEGFEAGSREGIALDARVPALVLADSALRARVPQPFSRFGVAESPGRPLAGPMIVSALQLEADVPEGTAAVAEARGYVDGAWTEWREAQALDHLGGVTAVQTRVWLYADRDEVSPMVRRVSGTLAPAMRAAQLPARRVPTVRLWATREGLVGQTTANGHVIVENDRFVALPSKRALNRRDATDYMVIVRYRGRSAVAPVWDIGPWNMRDDYWNEGREQFSEIARWLPQAEAAFFAEHNGGRDGTGRFVTVPASIDLADGTFWQDLGMTVSDWVEVSFLWVDAASPPPRPTPVVTAKIPPPVLAPRGGAASYAGIKPSPRVHLPLVMQNASGGTTTWTVQNPSPAPVSGLVALHDGAGNQVGQMPFGLAPFASTTMSPASVGLIAEGFVGAALISATGPVGAVAIGERLGRDRWAYEGLGEASPAVALPLVFKDYRGWSTGVQIQNVGGQPATVQVQYRGGGVSEQDVLVLGPMATRTLFPAGPAVPSGGFAGTAVVESTNGQPLVVVANAVSSGGAAMAYAGQSGGSAQLHAPLVFNKYHGWNSGLRLFNLGSTDSSVLLAYHGGSLGTGETSDRATVPASGEITLYQPARPDLPEGFVGSASVAASAGSILSGVVSQVNTGSQMAMSYSTGKAPATFAVAPLVTKNDEGWSTGIQLQNPSPVQTPAAALIYDEGGALVHRAEGLIQPWSSITHYLPSMPEVPAGFRGSAVVQAPPSTPGLVMVVSQIAD